MITDFPEKIHIDIKEEDGTTAVKQKTLVFFPTFNESGNVAPLIASILDNLPDAHILVVDDDSPDQTGAILDGLTERYPLLSVVHRARKMGIGSAHKLAMQYAVRNDFHILITMDADFSHHPRYLPTMMARLDHSDFVTGSRYIHGGKCDYGLYRTFISRSANIAAKMALGLKLKENTTVYRGFKVSLLRQIDLDQIKSEGYSFAVESLCLIAKHTKKMDEFPIHFENRREGKSKISKVEIYKAILTILRLFSERLIPSTNGNSLCRASSTNGDVACKSCGSEFYTELYPARNKHLEAEQHVAYSCANHNARTHDKILRCLQCGLVFMKPKLNGDDLVKAYSETEDPTYVTHIKAREATSRYNLDRVMKYVAPGGKLLDVGSYCGAFMKVASRQGLDVTGLEPSAWAADVSRNLIPAPVIQGTLDDMASHHGRYDLITLWDVLEHFDDPVAELRKINSLLTPDGYFFFSTLMIDNWFPRMTGKYWPWYMDMHLYYFTMPTVQAVLQRTGFEILESMNYCHIITADYLMNKLGTLGIPGARHVSQRLSGMELGKAMIPFRFGDIKLFVCRKNHHMDSRLH